MTDNRGAVASCLVQVDEGDLAGAGEMFLVDVDMPERPSLLPEEGRLVSARVRPIGGPAGAGESEVSLRLTPRIVDAIRSHKNVEYAQLVSAATRDEDSGADQGRFGAANVFLRSAAALPFVGPPATSEETASIPSGTLRVDWATDTSGPSELLAIPVDPPCELPPWLARDAVVVELSEPATWTPSSGGFAGRGTETVEAFWALLHSAPDVSVQAGGDDPAHAWLTPVTSHPDGPIPLYSLFPSAIARLIEG